MNRTPILSLILGSVLSLVTLASAQVPQMINYQGRVAVGDPAVNFNGTGEFKFALVNGDGSASYWSNDDTSTEGSEPTAAVSLTVTKGLYSVLLGDGTLANMTAIPSSVFANSDVRLRVWFNDGSNGSQLLTPDQRIAAGGYAMVASTVIDGGIKQFAIDEDAVTTSKIADDAITSEKLASGLVLGGTTSGTFSGDGSGLTNIPASAMASAESPETVFPASGMVWIKPGKFLMGSRTDEVARDNDETQHWVTLTQGFWMSSHEVTQAEYQNVIGINPSSFTGDTNRPVETVSWNEAVDYCTALTNAERNANRIPSDWEYHLPTEAEWEYCARAGANARYGHGDDLGYTALGNYAWYADNSGDTTHPVEQKLANAWGLFDMHGNVYEWCHDRSADYPAGSAIDPQGSTTSNQRIYRGGTWKYQAWICRAANRLEYPPTLKYDYLGFRVSLGPAR